MNWPSGQDYREAIQAPGIAFKDAGLRGASLECDRMGLPRPRSGGFATVYKAIESKTWAVRCFNRQVDDQQERYAAISDFLQQVKLPYMVDFTFLKEGIRVRGGWYPILKMEWVSGDPLNVFIERNLANRDVLLRLAQSWVAMIGTLQQSGIAHGDLQHGNVLVVGNTLKLIDYDGMFVPPLRGKPSVEVGQPNYQLPIRSAADFGPYLDNFSAWVILVSIVATAHNPSLWSRFKGGDECLLFRRRDFEAPDQSPLFQSLSKSGDSQIAALTNLFRTFLALTCAAVPPLNSSIPITDVALNPIPQMSDWIKDHVPQDSVSRQVPSAPMESPAAWILDFTELPPIPYSLSGHFARERFFFWLTLFAIVLAALLSSWVLALVAAAIVGGMCALHLTESYRKQPTLTELKKLKKELDSNKTQSSQIQLHIKRHTGQIQEIRNEEVRSIASLGKRRHRLENEERKASEATRKEHESRTAPLLRERKTLDSQEASDLTKLNNGLGKKISGLQSAISNLQRTEANELANALTAKQNEFVRSALLKERIYDASIPGIAAGFKARLHAAGCMTAADVDYYRVQRVPGIGAKKASTLFGWRQLIENNARLRMPQTLSAAEQSYITAKFAASRINFQNELAGDEQQFKLGQIGISSRYRLQKERIDALISNEQHKLALHLGQVTNQYEGKYDALAREVEQLQKRMQEHLQSTEQKLTTMTRDLAMLQWKRARLERESQRYANVRVSTFLWAVVIGR
jgi:serine/threonine protein kinase